MRPVMSSTAAARLGGSLPLLPSIPFLPETRTRQSPNSTGAVFVRSVWDDGDGSEIYKIAPLLHFFLDEGGRAGGKAASAVVDGILWSIVRYEYFNHLFQIGTVSLSFCPQLGVACIIYSCHVWSNPIRPPFMWLLERELFHF